MHIPFLREFSWRMDENDFDSTDCKVLSTDANVALDTSEVIDYLANATTIYEEYLNTTIVPAVKPKGGTLLLYDLGRDEKEWESKKKKLRLKFICSHKYNNIYVGFILPCI